MRPVLLTLAGWRVFSYTVFIGGAAAAALFWLGRRWRAMGFAEEKDLYLLTNICALSALAGFKALHLWSTGDWRGGLFASSGFSFFGGIPPMVLAIGWFCRRRRLDALRLGDYAATAMAWIHAWGRIGCFLAGCCYGKPTALPWGVVFPADNPSIPAALRGLALHPTQLYEASGEAVAAALLLGWLLPRVEDGRLPRGSALAAWLAWYGALRFTVEFARAGAPLRGGLTVYQWMSLAAAALAAAIASIARRRALGPRAA